MSIGSFGDLYRLRFGDVPPDTDDPNVLWVDGSLDPPIVRVFRRGVWVPSGAAIGDGLRRTGTLVVVLPTPGGGLAVGPAGVGLVVPVAVALGGTGAADPVAARAQLGAHPLAAATDGGWSVRPDGAGKRHWHRQAKVTSGWPHSDEWPALATLTVPPSLASLGAAYLQWSLRANVNARRLLVGLNATDAGTGLVFGGSVPHGDTWDALGLTELAIDVELIEK